MSTHPTYASLILRDAPCDVYACQARVRCAAEKLACNAMLIYTQTGAAHAPSRFAPPDRATFEASEREGSDERAPHYKTLVLEPAEAVRRWAEFMGGPCR